MKVGVMVYSGELKIKGGSFELFAERLILKGDEISFNLYGRDGDGEFKVEGVVTKNEADFYIASKLSLIYKQYSVKDNVSISIIKIKEKDGKKCKKCKIKGVWVQNGKSYKFGGKLSEFCQKKKARD